MTDTQASGHVYAADRGQEVRFRLRATDQVNNAGGWLQGDTRGPAFAGNVRKGYNDLHSAATDCGVG